MWVAAAGRALRQAVAVAQRCAWGAFLLWTPGGTALCVVCRRSPALLSRGFLPFVLLPCVLSVLHLPAEATASLPVPRIHVARHIQPCVGRSWEPVKGWVPGCCPALACSSHPHSVALLSHLAPGAPLLCMPPVPPCPSAVLSVCRPPPLLRLPLNSACCLQPPAVPRNSWGCSCPVSVLCGCGWGVGMEGY